MSDQENPQTPPTPPAGQESAAKPEATPEQPKAPAAGEATRPGAPGGPGKRRPPQGGGGGGGGMPRRRVREAVPSLEEDLRYQSGPKIRDLDAEIADELEAALSGLGDKDLMGADTSQQARAKAGAPGEAGRKQGRVLSVHGGDVFVEVPGGRSQGFLPTDQFPEGPPKPGDTVDVTIEGYDAANGLLILTRRGAAVVANWDTVAEGMTVEARVVETNKGGLTVDVNGIRGFMPISQIDLFRVENAEQYVGQRLVCLVTDVDPAEHNLVVSRRALLEKQREEQREKLWAELAEGQVRTGVVRSVRDFGAFVDLGGVDGLLHVSEMSWRRGQDATKLVQPGQTLKVIVLKIDHEKRKLSLSVKQLEAGPWDTVLDRYAPGQVVKGAVTRTKEFGAFVEIEPGLEGLIHVSELAGKKVWRVSDFVKEGQEVQVKILNIDPVEQRMSLSLRQALPEEAPKVTGEPEEEADEPAPPPRPRNPNLRGGIGEQVWTLPEPPGADEPEPGPPG
jgi:small subunit ribosomal protein S1